VESLSWANGINSKSKVKEAGLTVLHKMAEQYSRIRSLSTHEPTIEDVRWEDLVSLFEIAFWIKWPERRIASPVFASKLCHFIFPNVFPVVDNEATGYFDYEFLWRGMKDEWLRFPNRDEAKAVLLKAMENTSKYELYPIETRIIELCHIGYANARGMRLREALPTTRVACGPEDQASTLLPPSIANLVRQVLDFRGKRSMS
jgi:hypothetical protein